MMSTHGKTIRTYSPEECDEVIKKVGKDEKTKYTEEAFKPHPNFVMDHLLITSHNTLNFKRKFNNYDII